MTKDVHARKRKGDTLLPETEVGLKKQKTEIRPSHDRKETMSLAGALICTPTTASRVMAPPVTKKPSKSSIYSKRKREKKKNLVEGLLGRHYDLVESNKELKIERDRLEKLVQKARSFVRSAADVNQNTISGASFQDTLHKSGTAPMIQARNDWYVPQQDKPVTPSPRIGPPAFVQQYPMADSRTNHLASVAKILMHRRTGIHQDTRCSFRLPSLPVRPVAVDVGQQLGYPHDGDSSSKNLPNITVGGFRGGGSGSGGPGMILPNSFLCKLQRNGGKNLVATANSDSNRLIFAMDQVTSSTMIHGTSLVPRAVNPFGLGAATAQGTTRSSRCCEGDELETNCRNLCASELEITRRRTAAAAWQLERMVAAKAAAAMVASNKGVSPLLFTPSHSL